MKKVLIITYYWPPAGGPGVQRWLNFVKHLPDYQIEPIVYIPSNPNYPIVDEHITKEVPKGVEVISQPILEPYKFSHKLEKNSSKTISQGIIPNKTEQNWKQKLLLWVRGNLFIPDARKLWINPSVNFLTHYLNKHQIDTIITTGPPHSMHLIGYRLKNKLNLKWVADFRDPWTTIGYHQKLKLTPWAKNKHINLENKVLNTADHIIVTSWGTEKEFKTKTNVPLTVITNGFENNKTPNTKVDKKFTISHIGSLLSERNPKNLWLTLAELVAENKDFAANFQLNLAGVVSEVVLQSIYEAGLKNHTNILGYLSHKKAMTLQESTQVLLLIEINSTITKAIIPGKLFEYLRAKRPILGIGPEGADFSKIINETQAGTFFNYKEKQALKTQILNYFLNYQQGNLTVNSNNIKQYTRQALTQKLAYLIQS